MPSTRSSNIIILHALILGAAGLIMGVCAMASTPLWTFEPLTVATMAVPANATAMVEYRVTNQSSKTHTLVMQPIQGISQLTTGLGICGNPFVLRSKGSCTLSLLINGSQINSPIDKGPVVCQQASTNQCYRPDNSNSLRITQAPAITDAIITVTGSPLSLIANGSTGQLIINNTMLETAATNIASNFTGTALDGKVTETGNTCANLPPGGSCTLTYTPGFMGVPQTNFTISGTNTNALTAVISIAPEPNLTAINPNAGTASGGTGVTLTGTELTGASSVTFDGVPATSVNVVNSTTVTAVTPAHAAGAVDVVINTPDGSDTLTNGYTYNPTAVGQASGGGVIACLNGGLNNLIAAVADNSANIEWGGSGLFVAGAQSNSNGASNTAAIVAALGNNGGTPYAAQLCNEFEVDSQGNTPCEPGNTCYDDWFLPAGNANNNASQIRCLFINRAAIGGFDVAVYWGSTDSNTVFAFGYAFAPPGAPQFDFKNNLLPVRCVRAFTP